MDYCYKVLIVEDDQSMKHYIYSALSIEGYGCVCADSNNKAEELAKKYCPDIILLDMGLRDGSSIRTLKQIQQIGDIPVIVVSARDDEMDKVAALEYGAVDYIQKPFGLNEFLARIKSAVRRKPGAAAEPEDSGCVTVCGLTIDYAQSRVFIRGRDTDLTQIEFRIVCLLVERIGRVVTYDDIISRIWGKSSPNAAQLLRVNIANIRRKLGGKTEFQLIKTVTGRGYMLRKR